jgi:hypothetical protein
LLVVDEYGDQEDDRDEERGGRHVAQEPLLGRDGLPRADRLVGEDPVDELVVGQVGRLPGGLADALVGRPEAAPAGPPVREPVVEQPGARLREDRVGVGDLAEPGLGLRISRARAW